jgi:signal transduction histidine kinase
MACLGSWVFTCPNHLTSALCEALPTAVVLIGSDGLIRWSNLRARSLLGREVAGDHVDAVFRDQRPEAGGERLRCIVEAADGRARTLGLVSNPLEDGGLVVVFQDITDQVRLQEERDRLLQLAAVTEVLPSMLHEVKNPLAAVTTAVEVLLDDEDASRDVVRTDLHRILGELRRMRLVLEGVGLVGKDVHSSDSAIDFAMSEVLQVLKSRATRAGIDLVSDVSAMPLLPLDIGAMRAVAFNLLTNAIQACSRGSTVKLEARFADHVLRVAVVDDGPGMAPDIAARCTELFFTTKAKGSGIGLALVTRLARSAGGDVIIDSAPGRGTRVEVHIPVPTPRR